MVFCSSKFELIEGENSSEREETHLGSNLVQNSVQISQVYCVSLSQIRGETLGQFEKCLFPTVRLKCTFCVCASDFRGGTQHQSRSSRIQEFFSCSCCSKTYWSVAKHAVWHSLVLTAIADQKVLYGKTATPIGDLRISWNVLQTLTSMSN